MKEAPRQTGLEGTGIRPGDWVWGFKHESNTRVRVIVAHSYGLTPGYCYVHNPDNPEHGRLELVYMDSHDIETAKKERAIRERNARGC